MYRRGEKRVIPRTIHAKGESSNDTLQDEG